MLAPIDEAVECRLFRPSSNEAFTLSAAVSGQNPYTGDFPRLQILKFLDQPGDSFSHCPPAIHRSNLMGATESLDRGRGRAGRESKIEPWMPPHDMISNIQARCKGINCDVQGPLRPSMRLLPAPSRFPAVRYFKCLRLPIQRSWARSGSSNSTERRSQCYPGRCPMPPRKRHPQLRPPSMRMREGDAGWPAGIRASSEAILRTLSTEAHCLAEERDSDRAMLRSWPNRERILESIRLIRKVDQNPDRIQMTQARGRVRPVRKPSRSSAHLSRRTSPQRDHLRARSWFVSCRECARTQSRSTL